jgi:hypothetical protein
VQKGWRFRPLTAWAGGIWLGGHRDRRTATAGLRNFDGEKPHETDVCAAHCRFDERAFAPDRSSRSTVINPYTIAFERGVASADKAGQQQYVTSDAP